MLKTLFIVIMCGVMAACSPKQTQHFSYNEGVNIIPSPVELSVGEGNFTLNSNTTIAALSPDAASAVALLSQKIKGSTGYDLEVVDTPQAENSIAISVDSSLGLEAEGYTLSSSPSGVKIVGVDAAGAFYGVQSLLQLLPAEVESSEVVDYIAWQIPSVEIRDYPRFEYRGLMLDVSRHFFDVDFIKKQLDVLAMYKINNFHWHLTEDQGWRIEIKKYPKLVEFGAVRTEGDGSTYGPYFYTQEQIKDVVAYAAQRHINVVPEIELPGHAQAALAGYPELSCTEENFTPRNFWGVEEDIFCAGNEGSFELLEGVLDEVFELFPSAIIHIGGDEAPKDRWAACPKCRRRMDELGYKKFTDSQGVTHSREEQLQSYFISRIGNYIQGKGREFVGWDEILEGGLPKGAIVMSWRGTQGGIAAAKMGHRFIMTPAPEGFYLDHYQGAKEVEENTIGGYAPWRKLYSYEPVTEEFTPEMEELMMGIQGNMWTEYRLGEESVEYMIYPRMMAIAEAGWSPKGSRDAENFARKLINTYVRLDGHGVNYHVPMAEGVLSRNVVFSGDSTVLEFNSGVDNFDMVYTLDGSEPTANSTLYTQPIVVKGDGAELKIATKLPSGKLSVVRTIPVERMANLPAIPLGSDDSAKDLMRRLNAGVDQTIKVRRAEGLFASPEDYVKAEFGTDTLINDFRAIKYDFEKPSLSIYEGFVELPESGVYTFASDMSQLWIDGELVIDNTEMLSRHRSHRAELPLERGRHSYRLVVSNMVHDGWPTTWSEVGFYFIPPSGGDLRPVTAEMVTY